MRFILSFIIWIVIVGGLFGYTQVRDQSRGVASQYEPQVKIAGGHYSLTLTPTFSVERDPFALTTETETAEGFELWLNGQRIAVDEGKLTQGNTLTIDRVAGFNMGSNEIYVEASPPISGDMDHYALRVQVLENDSVISEKTMWSSGGAQVSGTMIVVVGEEVKDEQDN